MMFARLAVITILNLSSSDFSRLGTFHTELMGTFHTELMGTFHTELMGTFHQLERNYLTDTFALWIGATNHTNTHWYPIF